jgi:ABC-2 type transport system ATP-binding protein
MPATLTRSSTSIPDSWLLLETTLTAARFVHIHANTEPVAEQVAAVFHSGSELPLLHSEPMTLRGIFLALAKSGRTPTVPTQ